MTRAMGIVIGLLLAVGAAGAGDVSVQGGVGERGQEDFYNWNPLYYLGGTVSHFEIVKGVLWPEAAIGAWFSERGFSPRPTDDFAHTGYWGYAGFFGMEESVTLVLGRNHFTRMSRFRPYPQIGVGGTWHQVWLTIKEPDPFVRKSFISQQNETSWRLLLRIVMPLRETRQVTAEWEWNRNFDGYYPHDRNANYILKLGYRFRAF